MNGWMSIKFLSRKKPTDPMSEWIDRTVTVAAFFFLIVVAAIYEPSVLLTRQRKVHGQTMPHGYDPNDPVPFANAFGKDERQKPAALSTPLARTLPDIFSFTPSTNEPIGQNLHPISDKTYEKNDKAKGEKQY